MPVVLKFRRLRPEDPEFEATLDHQAIFSNKTNLMTHTYNSRTQGNHGFKASLSYINPVRNKHKSNSENNRGGGPQRSGS